MRRQFGEFELDEAERRLTRSGAPVEIGDRAFDLLATLLRSPDRLMAKDVLMDAVWPNVFVTENNLQVQVSSLRRLLGADAISTVAGRGYRFNLPVAQAAAPAGAAPAPVSPGLVGRETDQARVLAELEAGGLVTLWGPGGIGKTELARAVAAARASSGDRIVWVDLTELRDPDLVASFVSDACGGAQGDSPQAALASSLREQATLLVLDNAEHLLDATARLVIALRTSAPEARILVTSQARLRAPGEQAHRLDGLPLPQGADLEAIRSAPATHVFLRAASRLTRRFQLTDDNAAAVVAICRRLDGIPLALELAAARLDLFTPAQLEARLESRFDLLAQGYRGAPDRQQTLQAVFQWSYGLLPEPERIVFRRLGMFAGTFDLDAAAAVAAGEDFRSWQVVDAVGQLIDRSLVEVAADEAAAFRLTETARAFALERLAEARDAGALVRGRDFHAALGAAARGRSRDLEAVMHFQTALDLESRREPLGDTGEPARLRLLLALGPALQTALSPASPRCEAVYREALELARSDGDPADVFHALWGHWHYLSMTGEVRLAARCADELAALAPRLTDDGLELEAWHAALTTQQLLGDAAAVLEASERALSLYRPERHLHLADEFGGHDAGVCALGQRSVALWLSGRIGEALEAADAALARNAELDHAYSRAVGLFYGAMTYQGCGRTEAFARAAAALLEESRRFDLEILRLEAELFAGRARFEAGDGEGVAQMIAAFDQIVGDGDFGFAMYYAALIADAELARGEAEPAQRRVNQALAFAAAGQGFFLSELHRLGGRAASQLGDPVQAQTAALRTLALARSQHAPLLELRAAADLARLGDGEGARRLEVLLGEVDLGVSTPDIAAAQALN
jgi:predicted ATPase/DNA-binding winged helix-turn-helix (wHTH) protein